MRGMVVGEGGRSSGVLLYTAVQGQFKCYVTQWGGIYGSAQNSVCRYDRYEGVGGCQICRKKR